MADQTESPFSNVRAFAEAIAMLNAASTQQIANILQIAAMAKHLQQLSEVDMSQALIETKMANLLNTGRPGRTVTPATIIQDANK